jgi:hypothetical protein
MSLLHSCHSLKCQKLIYIHMLKIKHKFCSINLIQNRRLIAHLNPRNLQIYIMVANLFSFGFYFQFTSINHFLPSNRTIGSDQGRTKGAGAGAGA